MPQCLRRVRASAHTFNNKPRTTIHDKQGRHATTQRHQPLTQRQPQRAATEHTRLQARPRSPPHNSRPPTGLPWILPAFHTREAGPRAGFRTQRQRPRAQPGPLVQTAAAAGTGLRSVARGQCARQRSVTHLGRRQALAYASMPWGGGRGRGGTTAGAGMGDGVQQACHALY
jgi:hypothetical protein